MGCYAFTLGAILSYDMVSTVTQRQGVLEQLDAMTVAAGGTPGTAAAFDAPAFVANALLSTVREPDREEVEAWTTLAEVAKWAKLSGDIQWVTSKSGSLLRLLAGEDEDIDDLLISEIPSVSPAFFQAQLDKCQHSWLQRNQDDDDDNEDTCIEMKPTGDDLDRARAFYRALANELWREAHNASTSLGFRTHPLQQLTQQPTQHRSTTRWFELR